MNKILKFSLTLVFYLVGSVGSSAFNLSGFDLSGTVTDAKGKAKKNVLVSLKHGASSVKTDKRGDFVISDARLGDTLEIRSKERLLYFPLRSQSEIRISLLAEYGVVEVDNQTEQVAYKPIPKRRPSGVITGDLIRERNCQSLYDVLKLGLPGVQIVNEKVIIRGINSFKSNIEPMFIIEGAEYFSSAEANSALHVKDIDTVEVDREGGAYGAKGANGVIIIRYRSK